MGEIIIWTKTRYRLEKHRDDLLELLSYLNIQQVHYVGNSAGGIIGYVLLQKQDQLIKSLCTFGTTAELKYPKIVAGCIVGSLIKLSNAGHIANLDNPREFNEIIESFIKSIYINDKTDNHIS
ncbi:alpha/beta fold hydrolase [Alkalihalobacterium chitinilyticum]|uniref:Alpha/beta hydrolase n=1 Tax=Alkalihalobacterium chitinilyticum TaxID=2980103 RepID=A0ABT5VHS0_9BACI|nr:alpha/beta fold hydrolase [Alkalihalobacterium chitinilyticum]MDE5414297.1 alpha/beta hydrolase [Alkalihalobacterium chitinilyticum]